MYISPRNVLFDFGVPKPEIYHLGCSKCTCLRSSVYFSWCLPPLLALSATSKSGGMSSVFSSPTRPLLGMKTQQVTAKNRDVHISTKEQCERRPQDKPRSNPLAIPRGKTEERHSPSVLGIRHLLWGSVCSSCWIYGLTIPRLCGQSG